MEYWEANVHDDINIIAMAMMSSYALAQGEAECYIN